MPTQHTWSPFAVLSPQAGRAYWRAARRRLRAEAAALGGRPPQRAAVVGLGLMGREIVAAHLRRRLPTLVYDIDPAATERAIRELARSAPPDAPVVPVGSLAEAAQADFIVECVVEQPEVKQTVLAELADASGGRAVLATNTSTLSIGSLAEPLGRSAPLCGVHFCQPVPRRPVVEVASASETPPAVIAQAAAYALKIGKLPVIVEDRPGFLVNRMLAGYAGQAMLMLCEGVGLRRVDRTARRFGMRLGPFELLDLVGLETALAAARRLWRAAPAGLVLSPVLPALVRRGRLGRTSGAGFYRYEPEAAPSEAPELADVLEPYVRRRSPAADQDIAARLFLPMALEAAVMWEGGAARRPEHIDAAAVGGLGFPAARGGPLWWARTLGAGSLRSLLPSLLERLDRPADPAPLMRWVEQAGS